MSQDRRWHCLSLVFSSDEELRKHQVAVAFGDKLFEQVEGEYSFEMDELKRAAKMHMCGMTGSIHFVL